MNSATTVRITEIFYSLQGEARAVGWPTVFVRLTGCPLRCTYCDTAYAFHGGERRELGQVLEAVAAYGARHVCVTGGEPLAQPGARPLLAQLCRAGFEVSLETSGALSIADLDPAVSIVMDLKTPGSGESARNLPENIALLRPQDQVKFVVTNREDYLWSCAMVREHGLSQRCEVLFSPSAGQQDPAQLANWILEDRMPVRFQVQLHKLLWGDVRGR
ncbi:MAG TPA: 7-carboxy-7-deazaguanine synthase QueE [Acidiferrobacteraceae bacterium]|nr:7-carboxy-7-deazaguanine synthase QueE [Acidiferrobacteraceae bacterium]